MDAARPEPALRDLEAATLGGSSNIRNLLGNHAKLQRRSLS
jgi:hypothetical protein